MNYKFALGAVAGMSTLALAVPLLAQVSNAASASSTAQTHTAHVRPVPTQADVQMMITHDQNFLTNIDAMVAIQKSATQAHEAALTAAASITDDTARQAAVQKADQDMRTTIQNAITANPALKGIMMPFGGPGMAHQGAPEGGAPNAAALLTKLGMTQAELDSALKSGQTIQQIAASKGLTLPAPPQGGRGGFHGHKMNGATPTGSTSSAQ